MKKQSPMHNSQNQSQTDLNNDSSLTLSQPLLEGESIEKPIHGLPTLSQSTLHQRKNGSGVLQDEKTRIGRIWNAMTTWWEGDKDVEREQKLPNRTPAEDGLKMERAQFLEEQKRIDEWEIQKIKHVLVSHVRAIRKDEMSGKAISRAPPEDGLKVESVKFLEKQKRIYEEKWKDDMPRKAIEIYCYDQEIAGIFKGERKATKMTGKIKLWHQSGWSFEGEWTSMHGNGVIKKGDKYEGQLKLGLLNAFGIETLADGSKYEGHFKLGLLDGYGIHTLADGSKYEGEYEKGKRHGKGTQTHADGSRYTGDWFNDKIHGSGVHIWADGMRYEGQYKEGEMTGKGTQITPDGTKYEGEFHQKRKHGKGTQMMPDGSIYTGDWFANMMNGTGVLIEADGTRYEGSFVANKRQGKGVFTWPDGSNYTGDFFKNKMHGSGVMIQADGARYEGSFVANKSQGYGIFTESDGKRYEGPWAEDKQHGEGKIHFPDGTMKRGIWENGVHIKWLDEVDTQIERSP